MGPCGIVGDVSCMSPQSVSLYLMPQNNCNMVMCTCVKSMPLSIDKTIHYMRSIICRDVQRLQNQNSSQTKKKQ